VGKVYGVTSNSWEYTGDGHATAYLAGAELLDMEFVQFHPTGMIWPSSVRGILVTEGVRGDGGVLLNNQGERFMFNYIPEMFAAETAATPEEARRWLEGDQEARRPPDLLTRDVVARAIRAEVEAGRGSPHGGAFLDIANQRDAETIKRKLPSMYHQFKQLGDVDITKQPMEVGPTCHYIMGGVRVDADTAATNVPGLYAAGEVAGGLHGSNRLGGNSLSDLLVFGCRAGRYAAEYARRLLKMPDINRDEVEIAVQQLVAPFEEGGTENPYAVMQDIQTCMENNVGIVRTKAELERGLIELETLKARAAKLKVTASRQYNPGWHYAIDLRSMLVVCEAIMRAALYREESRGGHTRLDFPDTHDALDNVNTVVRQDNGRMVCEYVTRPEMPEELKALL
jgi:succinate dehydrogenase / fumarate reductase flavoprotein subunit